MAAKPNWGDFTNASPMGAATGIQPYGATHPFGRKALADLVHLPGSVAVGDDARIRHAVAERVLTFFKPPSFEILLTSPLKYLNQGGDA